MKRFYLLFIIFLFFINTAYSQSEGQFAPDRLDGNGINEITYNLVQQYNENNNKTIFFQTRNGLKVFFTDNFFFITNLEEEPDSNILGMYISEETAIYINAEKIFNRTLTSTFNESLLKIENVILHELVHYAQDKGLIVDTIFIESYNITFSSFPLMSSQSVDYFQTISNSELPPLNLTPTDIPEVLRETIDFSDVYFNRGYSPSNFYDETIARVTALCFQQKNNFQFYWEMIELAPYKYCDNFDFHPALDNRLNEVIVDFVEGYIIAYDLGTIEKQTFFMPKVGSDISDFLGNIVGGITTFIFILGISILVVGLFFSIVIIIRRIDKLI